MLKKLQKLIAAATLIITPAMFTSVGNLYAQESAPEKLMLITDLHLLSPSCMVSGGANLQKEIDNDNKMFDKADDIMQAVVNKVLTAKPAGLLIAGDLTKNGEKASHNVVAAHLQKLVDAGIKVWVIPGNHDVNNTNARTFSGGMVRTAATVTSAEFATIYANMGYNAAVERDPNSLSYVCEPLPGLWLLAVDDNLCKERDKNRNLEANGINAASLAWILAKADEAKAKGKQLMTMMHHQLIPHIDDQESLLGDAMVVDVENIRSQFLAHDMQLFLTGHIHISNGSTWYNSDKSKSIVEVTTGSVIAYPCHVRNITMNAERNAISFTTDKLTKTPGDSNFASTALSRAKASSRATVSSIIWHNWDEIGSLFGDYGITLSQEDFTEACVQGLGDVISELNITMSNGNEQKSGVTPSSISKKLDSGVDATCDVLLADQNFLVKMMAKSVAKGRFHDMLDEAMNSALTDCTGVGTSRSNVTDDLTLTVSLPTPKKVTLKGDVNGDGEVDVTDINNVVAIVLGDQPASSFEGRGDVNGDGEIDATDLNAVINAILNGR